MTEKRGEQLTKRVDYVEKDAEEQVARGIVMVPDKVDLQGDFVREPTIREFASQFEDFVEVGQGDGGVMHAVWPSDHMSLVENEVLDEARDLGGETVDAGSWVQAWQYNDDELWSLVEDGILEGHSIGAVDVAWAGPYDQSEAPDDVEIPEEFPEDDLVWELVSGIIREVSAVDIPAVPDAQILDTTAAMKQLAHHVGNREAFIQEATDRGHSEAEAERLWEYLNRAVDESGAGEPGGKSRFARAGKAFMAALFGTDDDGTDAKQSEAPGADPTETKEGRTLSRQNRESLFATIDASLDVLEDAGVDHGMSRFTDRDEWAFDLTEHSARTWEGDHPEDEEPDDEEDEVEDGKHATGSDTPDDNETMTEKSDDPWDDAPEWAKDLRDDVQENSQQIDDQREQLEAALESEGEEKTAQIEIDGEIYEVTESEAKSWFEDGEQPDADPMDDAPDYVRALSEKVESVNQRIERINQQSGTTDQLDASASGTGGRNGDGGDEDPLKGLGEALS